MLKSLEFSNLKSWGGPHRLDFGRITGLFGANSSGKSSIIHLLLLLKQTVESPDSTLVLNFGGTINEYVDFGSFVDIVTDHDSKRNISFSLQWTPNSAARLRSSDHLVFASTIKAIQRRRGEEVVVNRLRYDVHVKPRFFPAYTQKFNGSVSMEATRGPRGGYTIQTILGDGTVFQPKRNLRDFGPTGLHRIPAQAIQAIYHEMEKASFAKDDDHFLTQYALNQILREAENGTTQLLQNIIYLGPLRDYPHRNYAWTGATPSTVGHRGEEAIQVLLAETLQRANTKRRKRGSRPSRSATIESVTHWLRRLGIAESLSLEQVGRGARIWEARLHQQDSNSQINLADVGFGVSQVLPVIVALLSAPPGSLVILEHPEIHLHPRIQSELADLLIDVAKSGEIQILLESHSEHLLARIQRRIAESSREKGGLSCEDVRLYFCEQRRGESSLRPLEVQSSGVITDWPRDFFGDILAERMALSGFPLKVDD